MPKATELAKESIIRFGNRVDLAEKWMQNQGLLTVPENQAKFRSWYLQKLALEPLNEIKLGPTSQLVTEGIPALTGTIGGALEGVPGAVVGSLAGKGIIETGRAIKKAILGESPKPVANILTEAGTEALGAGIGEAAFRGTSKLAGNLKRQLTETYFKIVSDIPARATKLERDIPFLKSPTQVSKTLEEISNKILEARKNVQEKMSQLYEKVENQVLKTPFDKGNIDVQKIYTKLSDYVARFPESSPQYIRDLAENIPQKMSFTQAIDYRRKIENELGELSGKSGVKPIQRFLIDIKNDLVEALHTKSRGVKVPVPKGIFPGGKTQINLKEMDQFYSNTWAGNRNILDAKGINVLETAKTPEAQRAAKDILKEVIEDNPKLEVSKAIKTLEVLDKRLNSRTLGGFLREGRVATARKEYFSGIRFPSIKESITTGILLGSGIGAPRYFRKPEERNNLSLLDILAIAPALATVFPGQAAKGLALRAVETSALPQVLRLGFQQAGKLLTRKIFEQTTKTERLSSEKPEGNIK